MDYWQAVCNEFYNRYARDYPFVYTTMRYYPECEDTTSSQKYDRKHYPFNDDATLYLTQREADCIYHMLKGLTIKETAEELLLSPRTVEFYLKRIKIKFGQKSKKSLLHHIEHSPYFSDFYSSLHAEFSD